MEATEVIMAAVEVELLLAELVALVVADTRALSFLILTV
jgi:hypothetical protein